MSLSDAMQKMRLPSWEEIQERTKIWFQENGSTWAISTIVHVVLLLIVMIVLGTASLILKKETPQIESAEVKEYEIPIFDPGKPQYDPSELNDDTLKMKDYEPVAQAAQYNDDSPIFEEKGGGTTTGITPGGGLGFDIKAAGLGPVLKGGGGIESGLGEGTKGGKGGAGDGFGLRGSGSREAIPGVTRASERAVGTALNWIARHQNADGNWSMDHAMNTKCRDKTCTGPALSKSEPAATALALLPFFAAGQTHEKGTYKDQIGKGLAWLIKNQKTNGDLSGGENHQMYSHGLCTIAMCEAYGMTQDSKLQAHAQNAIKFIETGMNPLGSWRYTHGSGDSDLSVFGWELMALKSAKMAGLAVDNATFDKAQGYLRTCSAGRGAFAYTNGGGPKRSMTGIGVLASQYLGAKKDDPVIRDGVEYLIGNIPIVQEYDTYYWYYATQAMHNVPGPEWEKWNRAMRKLLIDAQQHDGCKTGSWSPEPDHWGAQGGRLMITSLSCLTLEVYYRYTPLFKLDKGDSSSTTSMEK